MVTFCLRVGSCNKSLAGTEAWGGESGVSAWADKEPVIFLLHGTHTSSCQASTLPAPWKGGAFYSGPAAGSAQDVQWPCSFCRELSPWCRVVVAVAQDTGKITVL
jgi:hypothetical protein